MKFIFDGNYSGYEKRLLAYITIAVVKAMFEGDDRLWFNEKVTVEFQPAEKCSCSRYGMTAPRLKLIQIFTPEKPSQLQLTALSAGISHEIMHYWLWVQTFDEDFFNNGIHWIENTGSAAYLQTKTITHLGLLRLFKFRITINYFQPYPILAMRAIITQRIKQGLDKGRHEYR